MKVTVQVELDPTPEQRLALAATLHACNEAASWVGKIAFEAGEFKNFSLRKHVYAQVKDRWGLGAKSAKRRARRRRRKEARRSKDVNRKIAKRIVAEAERTGRGIALEDLTGIRERVRLRRPQRATFHSWAFARLGGFIAYKARRAGVPVVYVDPAYTSRTCAECGHIDRANRVSQARFVCRSCGFVDHADRNGSRNIRARGLDLWRSGAPSAAPASSNPRVAGRGRSVEQFDVRYASPVASTAGG
ncbi:transposase [Streptomyces sp. NPDC026092]|uniref:RNA-guided endonuclease InsQ/TnpB family protein n=1 Tax=Streptomyces sp. NPDC026092 TaxID=3154797 RepID=UPI0033DBCDA4